jgi:hypothetical protein
VGKISRKTVAWASGAALAVGGATAGIVIAAQGGGQPTLGLPSTGGHPGTSYSNTGGTATARAAAARPVPLRLVSISPASGDRTANGAGNITVTYNQAVPATAPLPKLSPAIAGSWQRTGDAVVFRPARGFAPGTHVTVTVTVTVTGAGAGAGDSRDRSQSSSFKTGDYSTLRLQEILAQLGYLPLTWTPATGACPMRLPPHRTCPGEYGPSGSGVSPGGLSGSGVSPGGPVSPGETTAVPAANAAAQLSAAYAPPAGTFRWQQGYPAGLYSFWSQGSANTLDRGAIMGFEADHGLPIDGVAGSVVWQALLAAAAAGQRNTYGYSYAIASEQLPETLTIWHDGREVFSSPANTGISVAPTALGTYPVYEKLPFQIMQGTNPDGSTYADPVEWVSYFNGGDAVHYFDRGSYGWPQSLGCVELPYAAAEEAYPYLPYGTLVTVTA